MEMSAEFGEDRNTANEFTFMLVPDNVWQSGSTERLGDAGKVRSAAHRL